MGKEATEVGSVLEVDVDEEDSERVSELARKLVDEGAALVLDATVPKPRNMAELLRMEEDGWPSLLAMPSPAGPIAFPLKIRATLEVGRKMRAAAAAAQERELPIIDRAVELRKEKEQTEAAEEGDGEQRLETLQKISADLREQWERHEEAQLVYYGDLFDTGVVAGWDEDEIGLQCTRDNFVLLAQRASGALVRAIRTRFNVLIQPRAEVESETGKDSPQSAPGSAAGTP